MTKDNGTAPYQLLLLFETTTLLGILSVWIALFPESPMRADCSSMQPGFNEAFLLYHGRDDLSGRGGSVTGTHQAWAPQIISAYITLVLMCYGAFQAYKEAVPLFFIIIIHSYYGVSALSIILCY